LVKDFIGTLPIFSKSFLGLMRPREVSIIVIYLIRIVSGSMTTRLVRWSVKIDLLVGRKAGYYLINLYYIVLALQDWRDNIKQ